uniref:G-protein coupled receptors family 1 profile domain-containing protein n=1 Tax=Monopterus albus TaxID=43700 RepID=A0A3Q3IFZ4_MONAL
MRFLYVILTVVILSHCSQLHTPTNLLLLSLAVADFLVGLFVMPIQIILIEPFQVSVLLCWIYAVFYSFLLYYDNLKQPGRYNSCYGECVINYNGAVDVVLFFILPITAIVILYMRVFVVAVSQARAMRSHIAAVTLQRSVTVSAKKSELKAARTLGVLVAVFLMCYCPDYGVTLTGSGLTLSSSMNTFMFFMEYLNSCLNPVIYAFCYPWFRKSVKLIVTLEILQPNSCEASILHITFSVKIQTGLRSGSEEDTVWIN